MSTIPATDFLITEGTPDDLAPRELSPALAARAPRERGLVLEELTLNRDHEGLLSHIPFLRHRERIYWLATSFDLGKHPIFVFPLNTADAKLATIEIEPGETFRWTLGEGAPVAPLHEIRGGIAVSIYVASSDGGARALGQELTAAANAVRDDRSLAAAIGRIVANPGAAAADSIAEVALTIPRIVGAVLAKAHDEVVGVFQGYFAADSDWTGKLAQREAGATIVLGELR